MAHTPDEREQRLAARERAVAANEAETQRKLCSRRRAGRAPAAGRERNRARNLAARFARKFKHSLDATREKLDADRAAVEAQIAKLNRARSEFHAESAADRARRREAWSALDARQKRLTAEWEETNRFHAEQTAALSARAAELAAREKADAGAKARLQSEVAALREEGAALEARARNARQLVDELEQRRTELRAEAAACRPPGPVCGTAHRTEGSTRPQCRPRPGKVGRGTGGARRAVEARARRDPRTCCSPTCPGTRRGLRTGGRVLATEQFAQLAAARAQWQEAERATVAEMEQLARTLRRREAELDARDQRLTRADARRREDG